MSLKRYFHYFLDVRNRRGAVHYRTRKQISFAHDTRRSCRGWWARESETMPKKTASAGGGASRNKPKSQKSIKLVHPTPAENDMQDDTSLEETTLAAPTPRATTTATASNPTL